jgi:hypothetical protein
MTVNRFRMMPRAGKLEAVLAAAFVAPVVMILLFASTWRELGPLARLPEFWMFIALVLAAWPLWLWMQRRFAATALLSLDGEGMTMQSGLPGFWRSALRADWQCRWADIGSVAVVEGLGMVRITRASGGTPIVLRVTDWVREGSMSPGASTIRSSELWQAMDAAGVFRRTAAGPHDALTFDLWKHRGTRAALISAACLFAYGAADGLVSRESWAGYDWRYYLPHVVAGVLAFAGAVYGLLRTRAPLLIAIVLAATLGFTGAFASYAALIRVNQLVAGPLETKAYRRSAACDALLPVEPGLPEIEYSGMAREYWCSHPAAAIHEIAVRKGLFGLYQVDLSAHTEAIRRFRAIR